MAWRDSRGSRRRLLLYLSSMVLGVAALVSIGGFGDNLQATISDEGRGILGADLALERSRAFSSETEAVIDSLGGREARRISLNTMVHFAGVEGARLSTVRAVDDAFPLVGSMEAEPAGAVRYFREEGGALVDGTLLNQFNVGIGDSVRVGRNTYPIAGQLLGSAQESEVVSVVSPRVYIPYETLDNRLMREGSRVTHEAYLAFDDGRDIEALAETLRPRLQEQGVRLTTAAEASSTWEEALTMVAQFLNLIGLAALLLGSIGVASAVHVYVRQRLSQVAVLRCLGASSGTAFRIYIAQAFGMGVVCAVLGSIVGLALQWLMPGMMADLLPVEVQFAISWNALLTGMGVGIGITFLFALLPLLAVRRVSPLLALRSGIEPIPRWKDPWVWCIIALIGGVVTAFSISYAPTMTIGLAYVAGLAAVFALLALTGWMLVQGVRRLPVRRWPFAWRQGLANLYRPNNQTAVLILALGLGTFVIALLLLVQSTVLHELSFSAGGADRPSLVLFDVQEDQREEISRIVRETGLPVLEEVPIITMRLRAVDGRLISDMRDDTTATLSWAHRREYRSTYRDHLTEAEEVVAGTFSGEPHRGDDPVPISLETGIAEELDVHLGDTLEFDVQGVAIETVVASLREVDWRRLQTNFFVVFPPGVLEDAPKTYVLLSRADEEVASATVQRRVAETFPNVTTIDLALVLNVVDALFDRIRRVVQFLALFSIVTGLVVLAGSVVVNRYQRAEESVLLKTLGASRAQVTRVMLAEYLLLGFLSAIAGLGLAILGGYLMARFVLNATFVVPYITVLMTLIIVPFVTAAIGWLSSRELYRRPVIEGLRKEV